MGTTLYLVFFDPGPSWTPGLPSWEQLHWEQHAAFMDRLFHTGRIVLGGPYADYSRVLVVVAARDTAEARSLFRDDPWAGHGFLVVCEVIEWSVFLDARQPAG